MIQHGKKLKELQMFKTKSNAQHYLKSQLIANILITRELKTVLFSFKLSEHVEYCTTIQTLISIVISGEVEQNNFVKITVLSETEIV